MDFIGSLFDVIVNALKSILPLSPFRGFLSDFANIPYLSYLNWFIPIGPALKIFTAWLTAIAAFYLYSVALRWVKIIGD